jgi:hypothetical protein
MINLSTHESVRAPRLPFPLVCGRHDDDHDSDDTYEDFEGDSSYDYNSDSQDYDDDDYEEEEEDFDSVDVDYESGSEEEL